jgi:hypothetical protein
METNTPSLKHPPTHVELYLGQDSDIARSYWDESFNQIKEGIYEYIEHGNLESFDSDIENFYSFESVNPKKVFQLLWSREKDNFNNTFEGVREFIRQYELGKNDSHYAFKEYINENYSVDDLDDDLAELLAEAGAKENFIKIITRGYSQGDYATVYIKKDSLEKLTGKPVDEQTESDLHTDISNLFWDCPLDARLEIDEETIYLTEYLDSSYNWNRDKVLKEIKDSIHPSIYQFLKENLPEHIEYEHENITMHIDKDINSETTDQTLIAA